jgi:hypothetical protein
MFPICPRASRDSRGPRKASAPSRSTRAGTGGRPARGATARASTSSWMTRPSWRGWSRSALAACVALPVWTPFQRSPRRGERARGGGLIAGLGPLGSLLRRRAQVPRVKLAAAIVASRIIPKLALPTGITGAHVTHDLKIRSSTNKRAPAGLWRQGALRSHARASRGARAPAVT